MNKKGVPWYWLWPSFGVAESIVEDLDDEEEEEEEDDMERQGVKGEYGVGPLGERGNPKECGCIPGEK